MGDANRQRPVIDLDELERQLRAAAAPRERAPAPAADDPLAELARIVGQDDPYQSYWAGGAKPAQAQTRAEPASFDSLVEREAMDHYGQAPRQPQAQPQLHARAEDAWDQGRTPDWAMRSSVHDDRVAPRADSGQRAAYHDDADPVFEGQGQLPPHADDFDDDPPRPARRRNWMGAGAVLAVLGVVVAGYVVTKGQSGAKVASNAPPTIVADKGPIKVVPENPGGIEVPNQDRQIYAKGTQEDLKGVKLVGGEEQPVDVKAAARVDVPAPVATASTTGTTSTTPVADPATLPKAAVAVVPGLGEARRVKTVSVRPDGTIIDPATPPEPVPARIASLGTAVDLPSSGGSAIASAAPTPTPRPKVVPTTTTASTTPAKPKPADGTASTASVTTTAAPVKPAAPKPTQVASVEPEAGGGAGGWAVQLAAPSSEQEARDKISNLQKRFSGELGGLTPGVRKADVNGRTIYRIRVGNLSKDDATALCSKLQASGGQCFIAKN